MKIAIDARALSWTGIGRYIRNLLTGLGQLPPDHQYTVLVAAQDVAAFLQLKKNSLPRNFSHRIVEGTYYSWREQTILWRQLARIPAEVFHFTHFNLPAAFHRPYVVTIHDVTRFIFPGQQRQDVVQQIAYEFIFKRAVERARAIICVSQTTADDLRSLPLRLPPEIAVIHEGVDPIFLDAVSAADRQKIRQRLGTNQSYLLFVGVWMSHKNIPRLLAAYAALTKSDPQIKLVLTGTPRPGYDNIIRLIKEYGIEHQVIFTGFVPHELLPALYAEATCFILPSLYEGFGLPLLEAAASRVPIVTSSVASMPEIMGPGAYYVNPESVASIAGGISTVLHDTALRQQLVTAAAARLALFNWPRAALLHHALYQRAMQ